MRRSQNWRFFLYQGSRDENLNFYGVEGKIDDGWLYITWYSWPSHRLLVHNPKKEADFVMKIWELKWWSQGIHQDVDLLWAGCEGREETIGEERLRYLWVPTFLKRSRGSWPSKNLGWQLTNPKVWSESTILGLEWVPNRPPTNVIHPLQISVRVWVLIAPIGGKKASRYAST